MQRPDIPRDSVSSEEGNAQHSTPVRQYPVPSACWCLTSASYSSFQFNVSTTYLLGRAELEANVLPFRE